MKRWKELPHLEMSLLGVSQERRARILLEEIPLEGSSLGEVKRDPHLQVSPWERWIQAPVWGRSHGRSGQDPPWKNSP